MAVKILIDSSSDINKEEADKLGITMMPMLISFDDEDYLDGVTLLPDEFYKKMENYDKLPKTSQITPFRFEKEFERLTKNGDEVIAITISSKLSGTYNNAMKAAENFKDKVYVIDSLNACIGERLLCLYALKLISDGVDTKEIVIKLNAAKTKISVLAVLDTLDFLKKGGRISSVAAFAADMFSLKPVIAVIEGEVKVLGKARGFKNGKKLLNSFVEKKGGLDFDMPYGVIWSGTDASVIEKYKDESISFFNNHSADIPTYMVGTTIGTHVGPGGVGIAFFEK